jgi:rubrerythrin
MIDRQPLLSAEPRGNVQSLEALVGVATAIEFEAVRRYRLLAALMEERGEMSAAATFRKMQKIEERHVDMLEKLARVLLLEMPAPPDVAQLLPQEISESWDVVQQSALLTPYRALTVAVANVERAFAHYSYIAARAENERVSQQAEALAREELAHAAEMRVQRRLAYHREFSLEPRALGQTARAVPDFRALDRRLMRSAASVHRSIAACLSGAGDAEGAALVASLAQREEVAAGTTTTPAAVRSGKAPAALLLEALSPLERASEIYEDVVVHASDEVLLQEAQAALERVVEGISLIAAHLRHLQPTPPDR